MNIFVETSSQDEIRRAARAGFANGVVLPEAFDDMPGDGHELITWIAREFAIPVCVSIAAIESEQLYAIARELSKLSEHVVVQLPLVEDAIEPMHRLSQEGVGICANFVFTGAQAVLAAKAGASSVRVSLREIEEQGRTGSDVVNEIRGLLEGSSCECDVMVASPQTSTQFTECINAGAQIISIQPDVLHSLLLHPLTDRGLDRFLSQVSKRPRAAAFDS